MRCDDRDDTSRAEQEAFSLCLLEGIRRFFLDFGLIPVYKRILSHAAAGDPGEELLRLG